MRKTVWDDAEIVVNIECLPPGWRTSYRAESEAVLSSEIAGVHALGQCATTVVAVGVDGHAKLVVGHDTATSCLPT